MPSDASDRYACVTVDLDPLRCYRDIHGLDHSLVGPEGDPTYTVGVRRILELFDELDIRGTFFVIGRDIAVSAHHHLLERADDAGHELANHTHSHHYDLRDRPRDEQRAELARGEGAIASVTGRPPVGFRAPGYNMDRSLLELCHSRDYLYDSSLLGSPPYWLAKGAIMTWKWLVGEPSRSAPTPGSNLLAPITAYRPAAHRIWRRDDDSSMPLEIPMCVVPGARVPVIGTSLHLCGARGFRALYPLLRHRYRSILNLEFHAIDFVDDADLGGDPLARHQPDLSVPWAHKRDLYASVLRTVADDYEFVPLDEAVDDLG